LSSWGKSPILVILLSAILLFQVATFQVIQPISADSVEIPEWIKKLARFWGYGNVSDAEFVAAIEYLIKNRIIQSDRLSVDDQDTSYRGSVNTEIIIPSWVKNNAKWFGDGNIGADDFANGIEFLIEEEIISSPSIKVVFQDKIIRLPSTAIISPTQGALISSPDGVLILEFEPGSVDTSKIVSIEMGSNSDIPWLTEKDEKFENVYRLKPDGLHFKTPVKFSMLYDLEKIDVLNENFSIAKIPLLISNGQTSIIENSKLVTNVSEETFEVTGEINHFTTISSTDYIIVLTLDPATEHRLIGEKFTASIEIGFYDPLFNAMSRNTINFAGPVSDGSVLARATPGAAVGSGVNLGPFTYICFNDGPGHYGARVFYNVDINEMIKGIEAIITLVGFGGPSVPVVTALNNLLQQLMGLAKVQGETRAAFDHKVLGEAQCDPSEQINDIIDGYEGEGPGIPPTRAFLSVDIFEPMEDHKVAVNTPFEIKYKISKESYAVLGNSVNVEFISDDSAIKFTSSKTTVQFSQNEKFKIFKTTATCKQFGPHDYSIKVKSGLPAHKDDSSVNCVTPDEIKDKLPVQKKLWNLSAHI